MRGQGAAAFLFIRSENRAIEIYPDEAGLYVERWESADEESDDTSVKTDIAASAAEALQQALYWLKPPEAL